MWKKKSVEQGKGIERVVGWWKVAKFDYSGKNKPIENQKPEGVNMYIFGGEERASDSDVSVGSCIIQTKNSGKISRLGI